MPEKLSMCQRAFIRGGLAATYSRDGYEWGEESALGTDCSGLVSFALHKMGYEYRITADQYYQEIFTKPLDIMFAFEDPTHIPCLFTTRELTGDFLSPPEVPSTKAIHVSILLPENMVIDANSYKDLIHVRPLSDMLMRSFGTDRTLEVRGASLLYLINNTGKWVHQAVFDDSDLEGGIHEEETG